jgi:hypothetical protein
MFDELLDERRHNFLHESHQKEVIARYCEGLEARLKNAGSLKEAQALVESSCRGFQQSCPSRIVRKFLESYARGLLDRHWGARP